MHDKTKGSRQRNGYHAEIAVAKLLSFYGRKVSKQHFHSPYDLIVDGWPVEVKCSIPRSGLQDQPHWQFTLTRNGNLHEQASFYVLRLEDIPYCDYAVHLVLRSPTGKTGLHVSFRSLISGDFSQAAIDWQRLCRGEFGNSELEQSQLEGLRAPVLK